MKFTQNGDRGRPLSNGCSQGISRRQGRSAFYIKTHDAGLGMAQRDEKIAEGIARAAFRLGFPVIAYSDCAMSDVFARRGVPFTREFCADLDYDDDGRQIITMETPPIAAQHVPRKVRRAVTVVADTRCVHHDTPNAIEVAEAVYGALAAYL